MTEIEVATTSRRTSRPGYRFVRRHVPLDLCGPGPVSVASPTLVAVDTAAHDNGARIDDLLRWGRSSIDLLTECFAACPARVGNRTRRRVLRRTRSNPWSQAERRCHDLLDAHGITGWVANHLVVIDGRRYFLDIAFRRERVVLEIDGYQQHSTPEAFAADRRRQNALVTAGWLVLRFTWAMLEEVGYVVALVRGALRSRSRSLARLSP